MIEEVYKYSCREADVKLWKSIIKDKLIPVRLFAGERRGECTECHGIVDSI